MEAVPSRVILQDDIHNHELLFPFATCRLELTTCRDSRGTCNQTPPNVHTAHANVACEKDQRLSTRAEAQSRT